MAIQQNQTLKEIPAISSRFVRISPGKVFPLGFTFGFKKKFDSRRSPENLAFRIN